jgi:YidC/Oxa1 family membrane protein insertase
MAYRLDGPTGLTTEGWWYSTKISPNWRGGAGVRDIVVGAMHPTRDDALEHYLLGCPSIVEGEQGSWVDAASPLQYIGVDGSFFSAVLIPKKSQPRETWLVDSRAFIAGKIPEDAYRKRLTNVSCRLVSKPVTLAPGGPPLVHAYDVFIGPKRPTLLAAYAPPLGLNRLIEYGWFGAVARAMLGLLHLNYSLVGNYGLAIIMLTVIVRSCLFPLSRRQALSAQRMQALQPEMKRLAELYKNDAQKRAQAQQELFRKHNIHPLGGCLPALIQLPIFLGLYRCVSTDVELRQAPLLSESIRWAADLSAPDMFWRWDHLLPAYFAGETGWLGPYLNLLPLVTVGLFLWQQKMFMPPPADEQAAMNAKVMQWMTVVMGVMFFKVPSGLCVYFIASSLWSIAERKLLPKTIPGPPTGAAITPPAVAGDAPNANGTASSGKARKDKSRRRS